MSTEAWAKATGIPAPPCKMQGCCCRGASPSVPYHQLLQRAAQGDGFARDFFNIFLPHATHEAAQKAVPGLVERTQKAAQKDPNFKTDADVVFYQCRFIGDDNKCQIWEDRPQLCRSYPDSPFMVYAPNCAFEPWAKEVKAKFAEIQADLARMKALQQQLKEIRNGQGSMADIDAQFWADDNHSNLSIVLLLTPLYLVSPLGSLLM